MPTCKPFLQIVNLPISLPFSHIIFQYCHFFLTRFPRCLGSVQSPGCAYLQADEHHIEEAFGFFLNKLKSGCFIDFKRKPCEDYISNVDCYCTRINTLEMQT